MRRRPRAFSSRSSPRPRVSRRSPSTGTRGARSFAPCACPRSTATCRALRATRWLNRATVPASTTSPTTEGCALFRGSRARARALRIHPLSCSAPLRDKNRAHPGSGTRCGAKASALPSSSRRTGRSTVALSSGARRARRELDTRARARGVLARRAARRCPSRPRARGGRHPAAHGLAAARGAAVSRPPHKWTAPPPPCPPLHRRRRGGAALSTAPPSAAPPPPCPPLPRRPRPRTRRCLRKPRRRRPARRFLRRARRRRPARRCLREPRRRRPARRCPRAATAPPGPPLPPSGAAALLATADPLQHTPVITTGRGRGATTPAWMTAQYGR